MRTPVNVKKLICYFQEKIFSGEYTAGDKLPSIRILKKKLGASEGAIRQCFEFLATNDLVEIIHGSGTYVKTKSLSDLSDKTEKLNISVLGYPTLTPEHAGIYSAVLAGVQEAAADHECNLVFNHISLKESCSENIEQFSKNCDGVIFLAELERCNPQVKLSIPAVAVGTHLPVINNLSFVDIDPYTAAFLAVKYFKERNIKDVTVLSHKVPAYLNRADIFASMWKQAGEKAIKIYSVRVKDIDYEKSRGYLFTTGSRIQAASHAYQKKYGKVLSQDHCILGIDGKSLIRAGYHATPCVAMNWKQAGEEALKECISRIQQPGRAPRRIYLEGHLVK
jgi:DNA-binding LacI/PurR family transcriptional regulator